MLKICTSHADYQQFVILNLSSFYKTFLKRIEELESSISKLYCLYLDILFEILKPYYSNTGRPATLPPYLLVTMCMDNHEVVYNLFEKNRSRLRIYVYLPRYHMALSNGGNLIKLQLVQNV